MSQGFYSSLVSVLTSSWENDMSVHMVVARNMHHGSDMKRKDEKLLTSAQGSECIGTAILLILEFGSTRQHG